MKERDGEEKYDVDFVVVLVFLVKGRKSQEVIIYVITFICEEVLKGKRKKRWNVEKKYDVAVAVVLVFSSNKRKKKTPGSEK